MTSRLPSNQMTVLQYTKHWKNSYNGESNIRFTKANKDTGITHKDWEKAQAWLRQKELLRKNNSITPKGRDMAGCTFHIV